jgi:hypothetical protein
MTNSPTPTTTPATMPMRHATQQYRKLKAADALNLRTMAEVRQVTYRAETGKEPMDLRKSRKS